MVYNMHENEFATITVSLLDREDGGVRVQSDDLPGLILSGSDKEQVVKSIIPAISALLENLGFRDFHVYPSRALSEIMETENPQNLDMHVQEYVVKYAKAA